MRFSFFRARASSLASGALAFVVLPMAVLLWTPAARAHASLEASQPADGSMLASAPTNVSLVFNEPVKPLVLEMLLPDGSAVALTHVEQRDGTVTAAVPVLRQKGSHALSWRVISADGHPVGGSVVFSVGTATNATPVAQGHAHGRAALIWLVRVLLFAGLFLGVGGVAFQAFVVALPRRAERGIRILLWVGLLSLPPALGLLGLDALDLPLGQWMRPDVWTTAWATSYGWTAGLAAVALALGWAALGRTGGAARAGAVGAIAALGAALAASGHASTGDPAWLARPAVFIHGVAIACWLGTLLPLRALYCDPGLQAGAALRRFSAWIPGVVALLIASGAVLVFLQFDRLQSLWQTAYGQVFLAKLVLLLLLFGLAGYNRYALTLPVLAGQARAVKALRRTVALEIVVAVMILAVASLWRFTPPPRSLAAAAHARPMSVHIHTAQAMADMTVTAPSGTAPGRIDLALLDGAFAPLSAKDVEVVFASADTKIEPISRDAVRSADGQWHVDPLLLPGGGSWAVTINIWITDFDRVVLHAPAPIDSR